MRQKWLWVLGIAAFLFYLSLYPFRVDPTRDIRIPPFTWPRTSGDWVDVVINVLAYALLGLACRNFADLAKSVSLAAALSASVELLQNLIPNRNPNLRDFVLNIAGTAIGGGFTILAHKYVGHSRWGFGPILRSKSALAVWAVWFVWQAAPFLPALRRGQLTLLWAALRNPTLNPERILDQAFALTLLASVTPLHRMRTALLIAAGIVAPAFISGNNFHWEDVFGALLALGLLRLSPLPLCILWFGWLGWKEYHWIGAFPASNPFSWYPFAGLAEVPIPVLKTSAVKALLYGGCVWSLCRAGLDRLYALGSVALLMGIGEAVQVYMPGRTPEITDPLLALLAGAFLLMNSNGGSQWESNPPETLGASHRF